MTEHVYICGDSSSYDGATVRKLRAGDLSEVWHYNHGATCFGIEVDPDGLVYVVGLEAPDGTTLRVLDPDGVQVWSAAHGARLYSVAPRPDGSVAVCGYSTGSYPNYNTTRCYDAAGNLLWTTSDGAGVAHGVSSDRSGNLFIVHGSDANKTFAHRLADGSLVWRIVMPGYMTPKCVAADQEDGTPVAYIGWPSIYKYDNAATQLWGHAMDHYVEGCALSPSGILYASGVPTMRALGDGEEIWSWDRARAAYAAAQSPDGTCYIGGLDSTVNHYQLEKLDAAGNLLSRFSHSGVGGHSVFGVVADPGRYGAFPEAWLPSPGRWILHGCAFREVAA